VLATVAEAVEADQARVQDHVAEAQRQPDPATDGG
jgi:hypothetical protein